GVRAHLGPPPPLDRLETCRSHVRQSASQPTVVTESFRNTPPRSKRIAQLQNQRSHNGARRECGGNSETQQRKDFAMCCHLLPPPIQWFHFHPLNNAALEARIGNAMSHRKHALSEVSL